VSQQQGECLQRQQVCPTVDSCAPVPTNHILRPHPIVGQLANCTVSLPPSPARTTHSRPRATARRTTCMLPPQTQAAAHLVADALDASGAVIVGALEGTRRCMHLQCSPRPRPPVPHGAPFTSSPSRTRPFMGAHDGSQSCTPGPSRAAERADPAALLLLPAALALAPPFSSCIAEQPLQHWSRWDGLLATIVVRAGAQAGWGRP